MFWLLQLAPTLNRGQSSPFKGIWHRSLPTWKAAMVEIFIPLISESISLDVLVSRARDAHMPWINIWSPDTATSVCSELNASPQNYIVHHGYLLTTEYLQRPKISLLHLSLPCSPGLTSPHCIRSVREIHLLPSYNPTYVNNTFFVCHNVNCSFGCSFFFSAACCYSDAPQAPRPLQLGLVGCPQASQRRGP